MAPSPTGALHIGTARTALFNLLFARGSKGTLVLRMEDTDAARSTKESEKDILDGFAWLGIMFDEGIMPDGSSKGEYGPYRQTERLDLYEKYLQQLLVDNKAYYCFCSKEELEAVRQSQEAAGQAPKYSGKCRSIAQEEVVRRIAAGESPVIRLKVVPEPVTFTDLIRGTLTFDNGLIGDIVIAKSLRQPLYNFAVVIDDMTMRISHVIRGDDHTANTPKQIAIARALDIGLPQFAHLPIILSATGKGKMSKRDGGTTIKEYRDDGYLPEALVNFIALLGWHPTGDQELMRLSELIGQFSLERVQKGGAAFNREKLDYFNAQYLRKLSDDELARRIIEGGFNDARWLKEAVVAAVPLVRERMVKLSEFTRLAGFYFELPPYSKDLLVWKKGTTQSAAENLERVRNLLAQVPEALFTREELEPKIMALAEQYGKGDVLWPLRVAVSGQENSPPPIDIVVALGKAESQRRIENALIQLQSQ